MHGAVHPGLGVGGRAGALRVVNLVIAPTPNGHHVSQSSCRRSRNSVQADSGSVQDSTLGSSTANCRMGQPGHPLACERRGTNAQQACCIPTSGFAQFARRSAAASLPYCAAQPQLQLATASAAPGRDSAAVPLQQRCCGASQHGRAPCWTMDQSWQKSSGSRSQATVAGRAPIHTHHYWEATTPNPRMTAP